MSWIEKQEVKPKTTFILGFVGFTFNGKAFWASKLMFWARLTIELLINPISILIIHLFQSVALNKN